MDQLNQECPNQYSYEKITGIAEYLLEKVPIKPRIGIICGSGLGSMANSVEDPVIFNYCDIPGFPLSTVPGHLGRLIFGHVRGVPVICMQGRFHFYEGYPLWKCVMPVRLMKVLGVTHLIASNAAGGLNPEFKIGDIMLIKDHVNMMGFAGNHPLIGPNESVFGPRFFAMTKAYDPVILENAKTIAKQIGIGSVIQEGVYTCMGGPNFETVAELRALKALGIDAVGMSTVHEVATAVHCGMKCFAFSLITNLCVTDYNCDEHANVEDILNVGRMRESHLKELVENVVAYIGESNEMYSALSSGESSTE